MVCGASRSGTTMLDLMLGNTSRGFSCGEVYAKFRPFRPHHFDPICGCGKSSCPIWTSLADVKESHIHGAILERLGLDYVVDSSKDLSWLLDCHSWAHRNSMQIANVLIWKDPLDLALSYWKRGLPIGLARAQFIKYHRRFLAENLPFVSINHRDLVAGPQKCLGRLFEILTIEWKEGTDHFWDHRSHHLFGSARTRAQVVAGESGFEPVPELPIPFLESMRGSWPNPESDPATCSIVKQLMDQDFRECRASISQVPDPTSWWAVKPSWYYRDRLRGEFRRRWPDRSAIKA